MIATMTIRAAVDVSFRRAETKAGFGTREQDHVSGNRHSNYGKLLLSRNDSARMGVS